MTWFDLFSREISGHRLEAAGWPSLSSWGGGAQGRVNREEVMRQEMDLRGHRDQPEMALKAKQ